MVKVAQGSNNSSGKMNRAAVKETPRSLRIREEGSSSKGKTASISTTKVNLRG